MTIHDYIVVGSGCAGSMAAQTLIENGAKVTMLDVGFSDKKPGTSIPAKNFVELRRTDRQQFRYLLGKHGEGLTWSQVTKGAQMTPPRRHMLESSARFLPLLSQVFSPMESLGYGGLGIGWGLQCWEYSKADLKQTGLDSVKIRQAYEIVAQRIGISATNDIAAPYTIGSLKFFQPSPQMDRNHLYIFQKYQKHQDKFKKQGQFVGRPPLALITKNFGQRKAYEYHDMDFYSDRGLSAWRPWITVDQLRKKPNFTYFGSILLLRFKEENNVVKLYCLNIKTNEEVIYHCRKLILASGALGSARVVLRSLGSDRTKLSLLCNPHSYIPCLQPAMVGKGPEPHKLGLGQLSYFIDKTGDNRGLSIASSYSYQSLMLFRLVNQVSLGLADARVIMQYLISGLVILIAQHPDSPSAHKYLKLNKNPTKITGDELLANYSLGQKEKALWQLREKEYTALMRKLRTFPLKHVPTAHGASGHYAGTLPFSKKVQDFRLSSNGRLYGTKNIHVADSSGFNYLPAKGLTFTLMANAHLVAKNVLEKK